MNEVNVSSLAFESFAFALSLQEIDKNIRPAESAEYMPKFYLQNQSNFTEGITVKKLSVKSSLWVLSSSALQPAYEATVPIPMPGETR